MSKAFEQFCDENSDTIDKIYVERHFETVGHGGDYDPLDNIDADLWLDIAEKMWDHMYGGYIV